MSSVYDQLFSENKLHTPPHFIKNNVHYEVITGSTAYGCNETSKSDMDIYGFVIPPRDIVFPFEYNAIYSFDNPKTFNQFQQHHIKSSKGIEYDLTIYNIVQFFRLCMENNPNMVDALFVPRVCVIFSTQIGEHVRNNAELFLTKHAFHKFSGYAASQLHKMKSKKIKDFIKFCEEFNVDLHITSEYVQDLDLSDSNKNRLLNLIKEIDKDGKRTKRIESIQKYGFDVKFGYHLVRLLNECEQILTNHTLVLNRDREIYKAIRRGEWSEEKLIDYFEVNEKRLKFIYDESSLRHSPDISRIRQLLFDCLEMHYGSLETMTKNTDKYELAIRDIQQILINMKL